jgi:hypothetical protein
MYAHRRAGRASWVVAATIVFAAKATVHAGQPQVDHSQHQQESQPSEPAAEQAVPPEHDMQHMNHEMGAGASLMRQGSGTSWMPDETPMFAHHRQAGAWSLMTHGAGFVQYLAESGDRGTDQLGSINWIMAMADRTIGTAHIGLRGMFSVEPWSIRGCGYPDLLASGETCAGAAIHDRQHPHDLVMELAATYDRPIAQGLRLQIYGGPAGEPALGPTAFPHRLSAMASPIAPITHHWFDATHITFGVLTGGVYGGRWKAEGSLFNGREPDEDRTGFDLAALDSWSGRFWFLPSARWAMQVSHGHLREAETAHGGEPRVDVARTTASATYHRPLSPDVLWASTIGWGRNAEEGSSSTTALLLETTLMLRDTHSWFGRVELSQKSGHDLSLPDHDVFDVAKLAAGYTRYLLVARGLQPGIGAGLSAAIVPGSLEGAYGRRVNLGVALFVTVRAARHAM